MDERRLAGLMGLCVRAGQCIFGEENCLKALRSGRGGLLLLDGDISEGSAEKYLSICGREKIPVCRLAPGMIGRATGKPGKAMVILPGSFAERIPELLT